MNKLINYTVYLFYLQSISSILYLLYFVSPWKFLTDDYGNFMMKIVNKTILI